MLGKKQCELFCVLALREGLERAPGQATALEGAAHHEGTVQCGLGDTRCDTCTEIDEEPSQDRERNPSLDSEVTLEGYTKPFL
mmetsp:Transcript_4845/g.9787  ORF Transcript_4845/g.9787 Transcript_4845/m.9787 type:complete len:83 (-) Transcript_4845:229-477(-)